VVCSCGGLTVRKELTADDGVVTTYTYDKSAAYAAAEYTSNGKPVGKCKNGSVTLNLSGSWGSYSGTFQMSNGKISYDDDSTFNALTSLQNVMGGIQQQFGLDQFMVLDTDNILPGYTIDGFLNINANFVNDTIFSLDNISVPESMFIPAVDLAAMTGFPLESITENAFSLSDYGTFPGAITII
jgi:hypothetical protein